MKLSTKCFTVMMMELMQFCRMTTTVNKSADSLFFYMHTVFRLSLYTGCHCKKLQPSKEHPSLFFALQMFPLHSLLLELCLLNVTAESSHKALTLKEKKSFLEKQLWQEIENKSGCIYPLSGHVIVRRESAEREWKPARVSM